MSATDKPLKTTLGMMPVPQVYDDVLGDWVPTKGTGGVPDVRVTNLPATQAVTVVDGGNVTQGAKADTAATDDTGTWSLIALVKRLLQKWTAGLDVTDRAARLMGHVTVDGLPALTAGTAIIGKTGIDPTANGVSPLGATVKAAGKKTDADATDRTITTTGFNRIALDCSDCTSEMTFTVDEAIAAATKPVYVKSGTSLDVPAAGSVLHYSGAGTFRYILL